MPQYTYKHPKKEKYIEVTQRMNEEHVYLDETGTKWERVYEVPRVAFDSKIDPSSEKDFVRATASKKGTIGDIIDYSKEMSERRGGADKDPIIAKRREEYKKQTGREHPDVKKEKSKKRLQKLGVKVEI